MSGRMFEKDGGKALDAAERSTVNHDRAFLGAIGVDILKLEALGEIVVHLDGTKLPLAAEGILNHEIKFWSVEGCFAVLYLGRESFLFAGLDDSPFGPLPVLFATDVLLAVHFVAERYLSLELIELEHLEHILDQIDNLLELILELVRTHVHVGVVLSETADSGKSVQLTALLIPVHCSELRKADGKLLV